MGPIPEPLGSGTSRLRRTPALDLAQQAQLAACNYLGYNPRDLPNAIWHQQGLDKCRPLELHMHHHHHHYVATPSHPFSQARPKFEGKFSEIPVIATSANEVTIRVGSPVPANTTSTTTTTYSTLGLHGSCLEPPYLQGIQTPCPPQHSSSQLVQQNLPEDIEAPQRYVSNALTLKHKIGYECNRAPHRHYGQEHISDIRIDGEKMGRELGFPDSGPIHAIDGERKSFGLTKKLSSSQDEGPETDGTCSPKSKCRSTGDKAFLLNNCEKPSSVWTYESSYNSFSDDNSVTDDSISTRKLVPIKCRRNLDIPMNGTRTQAIRNEETTEKLERTTLPKSQGVVKSAGCCPSGAKVTGSDSNFHSGVISPHDNASSSPEGDSVSSSGRKSEQPSTVGTWTCSTCTKVAIHCPESSMTDRAAKASSRARTARRRLRESRDCESIQRKSSKRLPRRRDEGERIAYGTDTDSDGTAHKAVEDRSSNVHEEKSSLRETCQDGNERGYTEKATEVGSGGPNFVHSDVQSPTKITLTEQADIAWANQKMQPLSDDLDKIGTNMLILDNLRDDEPCTSDRPSFNKLREAVETAWHTNLGTKSGISDKQSGDAHKHHDSSKYDVFREESHHLESKDRPSISATVEERVRGYEEAWKANLGTNRRDEEIHRKKESADPIFQNIHIDHQDLKALVAREESIQRELKDQAVARVAAEEKARLAAEHKAHAYAATAKAAEEGLRVLLDERAEFHSKFQEELEQVSTDRLRLQELLQLEKLKLEATEGELREVRKRLQESLAVGSRAQPGKNLQEDPRLDVLSVHVAAPYEIGVEHDESRRRLMTESEGQIAAEAKASFFEASAKAAEKRLRSMLDERNWYHKRFKEELEISNADMIKMRQLMELENARDGRSSLPQKDNTVDTSSLVASSMAHKNLDNSIEDGERDRSNEVQNKASFHSRMKEELTPGKPLPDSVTLQQERAINTEEAKTFASTPALRSISKIEKKRPPSPLHSPRVRHWKPLDGPFSVKVERCGRVDSEKGTVTNFSPRNLGLKSFNSQYQETTDSPKDLSQIFQLEARDPVNIKEDTSSLRNAPLPIQSVVSSSDNSAAKAMPLPTKWRKETKAELRRMIQQQELTWKIAEDAVEELGRRLELLERYKMDIQQTLDRSRAVGNMDCFFTRPEEKLEDFPSGFNSLYNSPIYEGRKSICNSPTGDGMIATGGQAAQSCCMSSRLPIKLKDSQIQQLKAEIGQLKEELERRERKIARSPKRKSDSQSLTGSPRSPRFQAPPSLVPDLSAHLRSGFEAPVVIHGDTAQSNDVVKAIVHAHTPEVTEKETGSELPDDPFEDMNNGTMLSTRNGGTEHIRIRDPNECCPKREGREMHSRTWTPSSGKENGQKSATSSREEEVDNQTPKMSNWVTARKLEGGQKFSASRHGLWDDGQIKQMACSDGQDTCNTNSKTMSVDLNSNEGDLKVLKAAVRKLSHIFWEQEGKVRSFKVAGNKGRTDSSQATMDLRHLYLEVLKGMSQQLGELCRDLHSNTQPHELMHRYHGMDVMDQPPAAIQTGNVCVEEQKIREAKFNHHLAEELDSRTEQSFEVNGEQADKMTSEAKILKATLMAAERKLADQISANQLLMEQLESGAKHLQQVLKEHTEEIKNKDQSLADAHQLNEQLAKDMSQAEFSLAELRSRYKNLVSNLEHQLDAARSEAVSLQDTVNQLKVEIMSKESFVENVQGETRDLEGQLEELRCQLEETQSQNNAAVEEKVKIGQSLGVMRKEVQEQHDHVKELIGINEDLLAYLQAKEDEISALTKTVGNLEQSVVAKSAEVEAFSVQTLTFSQEVVEARKETETYRLRCANFKSKLDETEQELLAREESLERLSQYVSKTIEGEDLVLEEKEQLLLSLNKAQYREHRMDNQVRQSKIIIQDLEEKIGCMDADINKARLELADIKAKEQQALAIERQAGEMRNRVHQLEEEVMEKEGQITILKTSFPRQSEDSLEYTSTFASLEYGPAF